MTNVLKPMIERPVTTTAVLGTFLALATETTRGIVDSRRKREVGIVPYSNDEGPTCIFLAGRGQDNRIQAEALVPLVKPYGSLYFPYQCGKDYSTETTFDQIEEICQTDGQRERIIVATSMGAMEAMKGFVEPRVTQALGEGGVRAFVVLSGITSRADVQSSFSRLLSVSVYTPSLPLIDDICRGYSAFESRKHSAHSDMMSAENLARSRRASARTRRKVTRQQDRIIRSTPAWQEGSHHNFAASNPDMEIIQITADVDNVVDRLEVRRHLESSFGRNVVELVDHLRGVGHAEDIAFPGPLVQTLARISSAASPELAPIIDLAAYKAHRLPHAS